MKYVPINKSSNISINKSYTALPIEMELIKATQEKTPIDSAAPMIYTERKAGVRPEYDIRHDSWETAHEGMAKVAEARILQMNKKDEKKPSDGENSQPVNKGTPDTV